MSLRFRPAHPLDAPDVAPLLYAADQAILDYFFSFYRFHAPEFLAYAYRQGRGYFGFHHTWVGEKQGQIVCAGSAFAGREMLGLLWTTIHQTLDYFGPGLTLARILPRALTLAWLSLPPQSDSLYITNVGVHPHFRGQGIGSAFFTHLHQWARTQGFPRCELDVSLANPRAQALYERLHYRVHLKKAIVHPITPGAIRMCYAF